MRVELRAHYLDSQPAPHFLGYQARATADVENPAYRQRVPRNRSDDRTNIAKPVMNTGNITICSID